MATTIKNRVKTFTLMMSFFIVSFSFAQTITSVSPNKAQQGQTLSVTISTLNIDFSQGSPTSSLSKGTSTISTSTVSVDFSGFKINFTIPINADTGLWDVNVNTKINGIVTLTKGFTITPHDPAPAAPVLSSPANNAVIASCRVGGFAWNAPQYAVAYEIIIDNDSVFSSPITHVVIANNSYYPYNNYFANGKYFWKVRAENTLGQWGNWSSIALFTTNSTPSLASAKPDTIQLGQTLSVYISGQCTNFKQGSPTSWLSKGNTIINTTSKQTIFSDSLLVITLTPTGYDTGTWDIKIFNNKSKDTLVLKNGLVIRLPDPAPAAPILSSPSNNAIFSSCKISSFTWNIPQYASSYEFIVDNDSLFSSPIIHDTLFLQNSFNPWNINFTKGKYYWKVRAKNAIRKAGNWSSVASFTMNYTPVLTSVKPDTAQQGQTLTVTITGSCTKFSQGSPTSWLSRGKTSIAATNTSFTSDTTLFATFIIPFTASPCVWDVNVHFKNATDTLRIPNGFSIKGNNHIGGRVYYDANKNCLYDKGEMPIKNALVQLSPGTIYATTNADGYYAFPDTGSYTISHIIQNAAWKQQCPTSPTTYSVNVSGCQTSNGNDFADTLFFYCPILQVDVSGGILRRCFSWTPFYVYYCNKGNAPANNVFVELTLDSKLSINSSSLSYTNKNGVYTFNIGTIQPNTCGSFNIYTTVSCNAKLNDTLCANIKILPAITCGGVDTMGFTTNYSYCGIIRGSYDPNEKSLMKPLTAKFVNPSDELHYQINFQNTGNDTAFKIIVRDTLSSYMDIATVQSGASSHPYTFRIYGKGILEWTFGNILLPDSFVNEPLSHGFVQYSVKQKSGNTDGSIVKNTAAIYFDYNVPVLTNTVENTISSSIFTYVDAVAGNFKIVAYPNPSQHGTTFYITEEKENAVYNFELYNMIGEKVKEIKNITSSTFYLSTDNIVRGVYYYKIYNNTNKIRLGKLVILE